jgi:hypothetical protein
MEEHRLRRYLLLTLFGLLACALETRAEQVAIGGPLFECRSDWTFSAGDVQVQFSRGQLAGAPPQSPSFEVTPRCGGTSLVITFDRFVKNVTMRVHSAAFVVRILGAVGGSVNPGGATASIPGPTASIFLFSTGNDGFSVKDIVFEQAAEPALFVFGPTTTGRVLTHKYRSDDEYPSAYQKEDGKIAVEGLVRDITLTKPLAGRTVYFRLIDPPDTAEYVRRNGDAHPNDNEDGPGTLNGSAKTSATSDANGKVSVTLGITDHVAGDNYQVEASLSPDFNCSPAPCERSIVYTAWKRVYVEMHKMFRRGAFITEPVLPGDKVIVIDDVTEFPVPPFTVRLIHASNVEASVPDFTSEEVLIVRTQRDANGAGQLILDGADDPQAPGVSRAYFARERVRGIDRPYLRDAVGLVSGDRDRDYFLTPVRFVNAPFDEAFVEYVWLTDSEAGVDGDLLADQRRIFFDSALPHLEQRVGLTDADEREWLTRKWLHNVVRTSTRERRARSNHQAFFLAPRHATAGGGSAVLKFLGLTTVADYFNDTWLFVQEDGMNDPTRRGEAAVHELAHQWRVNPVPSDQGGHCDGTVLPRVAKSIYNRPKNECNMSSTLYFLSNQNGSDGVVGFHYLVVGSERDSEYLRFRRRAEPVPQDERVGVRNPQ